MLKQNLQKKTIVGKGGQIIGRILLIWFLESHVTITVHKIIAREIKNGSSNEKVQVYSCVMPGANCCIVGYGSSRRQKGLGIFKLPKGINENYKKWREGWLKVVLRAREADAGF